MPESGRPSLGPSLSFSGSSSASVVPRLPKRRLGSSSDLEFFAPAASSFQPRPYAPNLQAAESRSRALHATRNSRSHDALTLPPPGMDPLPSDPNVIFIHPPFTTFPASHLHPDGLTYPLMAENSEWFLDANDFISQHNTNSQAIPYPSHLEPPRGWCPAKKKDLKELGPEGWPEGEEPRLRCTFCRRTYAGVNAKSMWRRHVFEKHKIAMSNRRDGSDRPRGRGSGKENRTASSSRVRDEPHTLDKVVKMDVAPQTDPQSAPHKSKFRSLLPPEESKNRRERDRAGGREKMAPPSAPRIPQEEFLSSAEDETVPRRSSRSRTRPPPLSPPLTPQPSSDSVNTSMESSDGLLAISPASILPAIPPSPYDPLLTPSFRHSPPRLPSDQPWRFPSPSHPLHSQTRELTLSMLIRDTASPLVKGSSLIGGSPLTMHSPVSSPRVRRPYFGGLDTPASAARLQGQTIRKLFPRSHLPSPVSGRLGEMGKYRIEASPLTRTTGAKPTGHKKSLSELTDEWLSSPARLPLDPAELLASNDPFVSMYSSWTPVRGGASSHERDTPSKVILGAESPVLRNSSLPAGVGLGIGLLEPFTLPKVDSPSAESDDFSELYPSPTAETCDEAEVAGALTVASKEYIFNDEVHESSPPLKKRRTSIESRG